MSLVSVNAEDLAAVVEMACLTADRTNDEHRSLLAVAERCDKKRNAKVSPNGHPAKGAMWAEVREDVRVGTDPDGWLRRIRPESVLERNAHDTRALNESGDRHIKPSWERKKKGRQ